VSVPQTADGSERASPSTVRTTLGKRLRTPEGRAVFSTRSTSVPSGTSPGSSPARSLFRLLSSSPPLVPTRAARRLRRQRRTSSTSRQEPRLSIDGSEQKRGKGRPPTTGGAAAHSPSSSAAPRRTTRGPIHDAPARSASHRTLSGSSERRLLRRIRDTDLSVGARASLCHASSGTNACPSAVGPAARRRVQRNSGHGGPFASLQHQERDNRGPGRSTLGGRLGPGRAALSLTALELRWSPSQLPKHQQHSDAQRHLLHGLIPKRGRETTLQSWLEIALAERAFTT